MKSPESKFSLSRRIVRLAQLRRKYLSDNTSMFVVAAIVGLITGMAAALLKWIIALISLLLTSGYHAAAANWQFLIIPVAGIVLTGIFVRYILRIDITNGTSKLISDVRHKMYRLNPRITYGSMIASSLTLGFGGSAGSEGPIAYVGAAIGSTLGRLARFSPRLMKIMMGCGAGAGIAGIFKAPVGGFLYTLEVLRMELSTISVMAVLTSAVIAAMTAFVCSGFTIDLVFDGIHTFDPSITVWYLILGLFCGIYALYYSTVMARMQRVYDHISNPWLRNLSGGVILAAAVFMFPVLYGEGYSSMARILACDSEVISGGSAFGLTTSASTILLMAGGILLLKSFASSAANSSGGVAGDFAPTLFAGCIAGFLFASFFNFAGLSSLSVADFAFVAMAGVMAGVVRAPLMALFLVVEMTGCYTLFLPALIVAAVSFGVVRLASRSRFFRLS